MLEEGFIKLYRSITKWEWYDDANTFRVFVHLLLTVNYYDHQWHGIEVKRGQRIYSRAHLAKELRRVRTAISHLISTGEVTSQTYPQYSIITVNHYDKFQKATGGMTDDRPDNDRPVTGDRPQSKNDKKAKNVKNERNSYCPEQTLPTEPPVISFVLNDKSEYPVYERQTTEWREAYPAVDIRRELFKMKAWLDANPRKRKTKAGILRFVVNWLSRAQDKGGDEAEEEPPEYEYRAPTPEDDAPFERYIPENAKYEDILPPAEEVFRW